MNFFCAKRRSAIFAILSALILCLTACQPALEPSSVPLPDPTQAATPEPSPTTDWFPATATPTQRNATPTVNPVAELTPPPKGDLLFTDDFDDERLWVLGRNAAGSVAFGKNNISLAVAGSKAELTSLSRHKLPANFYLEMSVDSALCSGVDALGIIFWRFSELGTYRLLLNCAGEIQLDRTIFETVAVLQGDLSARGFQSGSPAKNRIGIWAQNGAVHFFVNGRYQFTEQVRKGLSGELGVYARASAEGPVTFVFSDLAVYAVEP